jgi:hypothetical protein
MNFMTFTGSQRVFRVAVWAGRIAGWALLVLGVLGILQAEFFAQAISSFKMLPSLALTVVAVVWIIGLELFLHFFDRYLSRN